MEPNIIDYLLAGVYLFASRIFWEASDRLFDREEMTTGYILVGISACFGVFAILKMGF